MNPILSLLYSLKKDIEANELFQEVFLTEYNKHPNSKHNWRNYYKAKNNTEYANHIISLINTLIKEENQKALISILNIKYTPSKKAKDIIYNKSKEFGECW